MLYLEMTSMTSSLKDLLRDFDPFHQRAILCAKYQNISAWLSFLPPVKNHSDFDA